MQPEGKTMHNDDDYEPDDEDGWEAELARKMEGRSARRRREQERENAMQPPFERRFARLAAQYRALGCTLTFDCGQRMSIALDRARESELWATVEGHFEDGVLTGFVTNEGRADGDDIDPEWVDGVVTLLSDLADERAEAEEEEEETDG